MGIFVICFEIYVYFFASEDNKWDFLTSQIMASPFNYTLKIMIFEDMWNLG